MRLRVVLLRVVLFRGVVVLLRRFGAVPPSESDSVVVAPASLSRGADAGVASIGDASATEARPSSEGGAVADMLSAG